jgi:SPP1 family predicted phage head-tail adaptor
MPAKFGAGHLVELVAFDKRDEVDDGYGNIIAGDWVEQFQQRAKFISLRGSETVAADQLAEVGSMIVQVRKCSETLQIGTDWQARDVRRGTAFNIRSVEEDRTRSLIELLVESGVATG